MSPSELVYNFKIGFDVIASGDAPGFTDNEIYSLLNRGQDYIILDLYKQKNWELLESLIKIGNISLTVGSIYSLGSLPTDYWMYVKANAVVTRTAQPSTGFISSHVDSSNVNVECEEISVVDSVKFLPNSFNNFRVWKTPKVYLEDGKIYIIQDQYTTIDSSLPLTYLRKRLDISGTTTCELQESLHRLVVDKAIDIAKTIINIQEPQSSSK